MTVIRRSRNDRFAIIPNHVAEDARLSFAERGLLVYLLAKPEGWTVQIRDLQTQGGVGRDLAYKLLNGLIARGYVRRDRHVDDATKRIVGVAYTVFDLPDAAQGEPSTEDPNPEEPYLENQDAYKELSSNKTHNFSSRRQGLTELTKVLDELHGLALLDHFDQLGTPLTAYTAGLKAKQLEKHPNPNAACDEMINNGWKNFKPSWADNRGRAKVLTSDCEERTATRAVAERVASGEDEVISRDKDLELFNRCMQLMGPTWSHKGEWKAAAFPLWAVDRARQQRTVARCPPGSGTVQLRSIPAVRKRPEFGAASELRANG